MVGRKWYHFCLKGRDLQNLIEKAFLDKLQEVKQGLRFKLKFWTPEHNYELFLGTSKMYQINTETGSKRAVKRRPGKVIANEDVEDLKWYGWNVLVS